MNEIEKRNAKLPAKIEDLQKYILVGRQVLKAHVAKLKAIMAVEDGQVAHQAALEDTQDMAEILLYAEAKLGALIPPQKKKTEQGSGAGTLYSLPPGVNKKQSHYAQELNRHQDTIAEVVAEAREKGEIPVRQQVLRAIQANKPKPETPPLPKGKYSVIYADPPWKYGDEQDTDKLGGATKHYPLMSIDELCDLGVSAIAADNAVLFMWVTSPLLEECFDVISKWGFKYKASFVWDKIKHNMGHYNSVRHEFLLICTRGSFTPENIKLFDSVQSIEKTKKHSQKPQEFRKIIETLYPSATKIELFARETHPGWEAFGNEL